MPKRRFGTQYIIITAQNKLLRLLKALLFLQNKSLIRDLGSRPCE